MPKRNAIACDDSIPQWRGADREVRGIGVLVIQRARLGGLR